MIENFVSKDSHQTSQISSSSEVTAEELVLVKAWA